MSSGTKKLVSLPIKSYKKDRKLLKGMQRGKPHIAALLCWNILFDISVDVLIYDGIVKFLMSCIPDYTWWWLTGAVAFIRSVSIEAVGLGVHLAAGAHDMLLKTESALTAIPPPLASREAKRTKDNVRANQPESAQEGLKKVLNSSKLHMNSSFLRWTHLLSANNMLL